MSDAVFIDGAANVPGCHCGDDCSLPCWQRVGIAPACEKCGCPAFSDDTPQPAPPIHVDVLDAARNTVRGARHDDYGDPQRNLRRIGIVWGAMLGTDAIPPRTVAILLAGMKAVRATGRENRDDLVDLAGYTLLADESARAV